MGGPPWCTCDEGFLTLNVRRQVDEPGVWTELGHAQLEAGAVNDAIGSYLRSGDSSRYLDVIARSQVRGSLEGRACCTVLGRRRGHALYSGCMPAAMQERLLTLPGRRRGKMPHTACFPSCE